MASVTSESRRLTRIFTAFSLCTLGFLSQIQAATYTADIYELNSKRGKKIYQLKIDITEENGMASYSAVYSSPENQVVFDEKATLKGLQIVKVEIDQKQTNNKAVVEFNGQTAKFSKTADGETKTSEENVKGDFVMSSNFQRYVASKWKELLSGKSVSFRYGVWDRMETVGFSLRKTGESGEGDAKVVELQMKPSSFIIAALVNPLDFKFSADGSRIIEMKGRIPAKQKDGSKWKDLDAEVVYKY